MKTKQPKIEIGTTFPHFWQDRYVNAEIVSRRKAARGWWLWTVRLTESQQPVRRAEAQTIVEFEKTAAAIRSELWHIKSLPHYSPREGSCVVQYIKFPGDNSMFGGGLWCEVREQCRCGPHRDTHWRRSECETVEALLASGDAVEVVA